MQFQCNYPCRRKHPCGIGYRVYCLTYQPGSKRETLRLHYLGFQLTNMLLTITIRKKKRICKFVLFYLGIQVTMLSYLGSRVAMTELSLFGNIGEANIFLLNLWSGSLHFRLKYTLLFRLQDFLFLFNNTIKTRGKFIIFLYFSASSVCNTCMQYHRIFQILGWGCWFLIYICNSSKTDKIFLFILKKCFTSLKLCIKLILK